MKKLRIGVLGLHHDHVWPVLEELVALDRAEVVAAADIQAPESRRTLDGAGGPGSGRSETETLSDIFQAKEHETPLTEEEKLELIPSLSTRAELNEAERTNAFADARVWLQYETYPLQESAVRLHHQLVRVHPQGRRRGLRSPARLRAKLTCPRDRGATRS